MEGKQVGGYAWDIDWAFWTCGHVNMCDSYYTLTDISGKMEDLNRYVRDGNTHRLQDMRYYQTYGQFLTHEMMHLRSTYNPEPSIIDAYLGGGTGQFDNDVRAYGPKRVHQLAQGDASGSKDQSGGGKVSTINADSYALLINSMFWWDVTQYFPGVPRKAEPAPPPCLPPPLIVFPWISLGNRTDVPAQSLDDNLGAVIDSYLISDHIGPASSSTTSATPSTTSESPSPAAHNTNACHGVNGDYWIVSRDQTSPEATYNRGSVNALVLNVSNAHGPTSPSSAPDCLGRFTGAVIDGCDGSDHVNDPHNYKFGSVLTTTDGGRYEMRPLTQQVGKVSCDVSYKFLWDGFEIRGKNLPDAAFGAEGEGLKKHIRGCGDLTHWKFEWTPKDCCFQWYAAGRLPIGTKACVGRALESAGGNGLGSCHGAG